MNHILSEKNPHKADFVNSSLANTPLNFSVHQNYEGQNNININPNKSIFGLTSNNSTAFKNHSKAPLKSKKNLASEIQFNHSNGSFKLGSLLSIAAWPALKFQKSAKENSTLNNSLSKTAYQAVDIQTVADCELQLEFSLGRSEPKVAIDHSQHSKYNAQKTAQLDKDFYLQQMSKSCRQNTYRLLEGPKQGFDLNAHSKSSTQNQAPIIRDIDEYPQPSSQSEITLRAGLVGPQNTAQNAQKKKFVQRLVTSVNSRYSLKRARKSMNSLKTATSKQKINKGCKKVMTEHSQPFIEDKENIPVQLVQIQSNRLAYCLENCQTDRKHTAQEAVSDKSKAKKHTKSSNRERTARMTVGQNHRNYCIVKPKRPLTSKCIKQSITNCESQLPKQPSKYAKQTIQTDHNEWTVTPSLALSLSSKNATDNKQTPEHTLGILCSSRGVNNTYTTVSADHRSSCPPKIVSITGLEITRSSLPRSIRESGDSQSSRQNKSAGKLSRDCWAWRKLLTISSELSEKQQQMVGIDYDGNPHDDSYVHQPCLDWQASPRQSVRKSMRINTQPASHPLITNILDQCSMYLKKQSPELKKQLNKLENYGNKVRLGLMKVVRERL